MGMMISSIEKWVHHTNIQQGKILDFNPGDVIKGKVMKLFPNQTALVQFNGSPLVAQLQAPLTANTAYWFEVQPKLNGKLQLKVITELQGMPERGEMMNSLLKELRLPPTKMNEKLITSLIEKNLPLPKNHLSSISSWLSSSTDIDVDMRTVEQMIKLNLPFTKETFLSARSLYDGSSFAKQAHMLLSVLEGDGTLTPEEAQLKKVISRILFPMQEETGTSAEQALIDKQTLLKGDSSLLEANKTGELAKGLKLIFQSLGLEHERMLGEYFKNGASGLSKGEFHTLKALLLQFHQQSTGPERDLAGQLIHKITGYQLLAREDGPVTSLYMQLPIVLGNEPRDVMIQWEGRQKGTGAIDPNYCRILFCLQLEYLNETIVDVTVQNRVVNIGIINDLPQLPLLTKKMGSKLKESLAVLNYHLSDIKVIASGPNQRERSFLAKRAAVYQQSGLYEGVDVKI